MSINGDTGPVGPTYAMNALTIEDFRAYSQIKGYDVISSGHFKRHLSQSRDNGDKWAIQMYNGHNMVQNKVKEVFTLVGQLTAPHSSTIHRVCKDVMSCAQPPVKVLTGCNVCCLTGVSVEHCIDLTRAGKNSQEVLVHPRFRHFFMLLWYCAKVEYVIRACTKQWLDTHDDKPCTENFTQICEQYSSHNAEFNDKLFKLFVKGMEYTTASLIAYRDKCALKPTLVASQQYLDELDESLCEID
jgi:hypothetical protein